MPTLNSNTVVYATLKGSINPTLIANGTAANTYTLVDTGQANGSIITDILFRSSDGTARNFNIIICPTGSQTLPQYSLVQISVSNSAGDNGSTALASLAALVPTLFAIDMAGNRVITLESGISIYVQNTSLTAGTITVFSNRRDY